MTAPHDPEILLGFADELSGKLDRLPTIDWQAAYPSMQEQRRAHSMALDEILEELEHTHGAHIVRGTAPSVTMFGFRAISTQGLGAALRNWIAQVRARTGAAK